MSCTFPRPGRVRAASFAVIVAYGAACTADREPSAAPEDTRPGGTDDPQALTWRQVTEGLDGLMVRPRTFDMPALDGARGLSGVAHGNGIWVAVGDVQRLDGMLHWATSTDGMHWSPASEDLLRGRTSNFSRLFFVKGEFVFFDRHESSPGEIDLHINTSRDAVSWLARPFSSGARLGFDMASDGQHVVGALGGGLIWRSSDLAEWTYLDLPKPEGRVDVTDVAFGDGRWVASMAATRVADGRYPGEGLSYTSSDGQTWERSGLSGNDGFQLEYGNGVWVALNALHEYRTSVDGTTFDAIEPLGLWQDDQQEAWLRFAGGRFLAAHVDRGQVPPSMIRLLSSEDGVNWSDFGAFPGFALPAGALNIDYSIDDVAYADCRYVVAGSYAIQVPGAVAPPYFFTEVGPLLLTLDICEPSR